MKSIKFKKNWYWNRSDKFSQGKVDTPLERCPFCGEVVEMEYSYDKSDDYAYVSITCGVCNLWAHRSNDGGKSLYAIADELAEAWNRRA